MDLRLNDEQEQLVDAFAGLFAKHASPEQVREAEPLGFDPNLWAQLRETGVVAMAVDEAAGGWGASLLDLALVAACVMGACFGLLWWNASPARIFMGDTGSLGLGAALAGLAITTRTELLMIVLGGLFVFETMSVILQVTYLKATKRSNGGVGKRLFRITPIHHHFEMLGWPQITVTIRFWII